MLRCIDVAKGLNQYWLGGMKVPWLVSVRERPGPAMISSFASPRLAGVLCGLVILMAFGIVALGVLMEADASYDMSESLETTISDMAIGLSFALVGGLVTVKRPENLVGWALLIAGGGSLLGDLLGGYAELAVLAEPESGLPAGLASAAIAQSSWVPLMAGVFLLIVLFPNGHVSSRTWRLLGKLVPALFAVIWLMIATSPGLDPPFEEQANPLAFAEDEDYLALAYPPIVFCLLSIAAAGLHLVLRFRRSQGDEREQFKWLTFAVSVLIASMPFAAFANWEGVGGAVFGIALIGLPVSVGVAVLKYRLYDIDILINRTLVYVPLTAILAGLFVASTALVRTIFTDLTQTGTDASVAASTVAIVALLTPLKNKLQALVDRYFKEQPNPGRELARLTAETASVLQVMDSEALMRRFLEAAIAAVDARGAALEIRNGVTPALVTSASWQGETVISIPLRHQDEEVGMLMIAPSRQGKPYGPRVVEDLERPAEVLAHALQLSRAGKVGV